jgi:hypothetical protein
MPKCPHCGRETKAEKVCGHCGKDLLSPRGMEVQYKDFKVTELLDIKMPGQAPPRKESGKADAGRDAMKELPAGGNPVGEKRSRFALAAVIIFLAAAAGFFLLKLLMKF